MIDLFSHNLVSQIPIAWALALIYASPLLAFACVMRFCWKRI